MMLYVAARGADLPRRPKPLPSIAFPFPQKLQLGMAALVGVFLFTDTVASPLWNLYLLVFNLLNLYVIMAVKLTDPRLLPWFGLAGPLQEFERMMLRTYRVLRWTQPVATVAVGLLVLWNLAMFANDFGSILATASRP